MRGYFREKCSPYGMTIGGTWFPGFYHVMTARGGENPVRVRVSHARTVTSSGPWAFLKHQGIFVFSCWIRVSGKSGTGLQLLPKKRSQDADSRIHGSQYLVKDSRRPGQTRGELPRRQPAA